MYKRTINNNLEYTYHKNNKDVHYFLIKKINDDLTISSKEIEDCIKWIKDLYKGKSICVIHQRNNKISNVVETKISPEYYYLKINNLYYSRDYLRVASESQATKLTLEDAKFIQSKIKRETTFGKSKLKFLILSVNKK